MDISIMPRVVVPQKLVTTDDRWHVSVSFSSREVLIDPVRMITVGHDKIAHYIMPDGKIGNSLGVGALIYSTREVAVTEAQNRVRSVYDKMMSLCR